MESNSKYRFNSSTCSILAWTKIENEHSASAKPVRNQGPKLDLGVIDGLWVVIEVYHLTLFIWLERILT
jgi:hypothetical protein